MGLQPPWPAPRSPPLPPRLLALLLRFLRLDAVRFLLLGPEGKDRRVHAHQRLDALQVLLGRLEPRLRLEGLLEARVRAREVAHLEEDEALAVPAPGVEWVEPQ